MTRPSSEEILEITAATRNAVGFGVGLHVLGIARLDLLGSLINLGVTSVDSASPIRTAWTSASLRPTPRGPAPKPPPKNR